MLREHITLVNHSISGVYTWSGTRKYLDDNALYSELFFLPVVDELHPPNLSGRWCTPYVNWLTNLDTDL